MTTRAGALTDSLPTQIMSRRPNAWPVPKFEYGQQVVVVPLSTPSDHMRARVIDLHQIGMIGVVEYDVRYFHEGKEYKIRVFEDELIPVPD